MIVQIIIRNIIMQVDPDHSEQQPPQQTTQIPNQQPTQKQQEKQNQMVPDPIEARSHKQSYDNVSETKEQEEKENVLLTGSDFKEWGDNTPLEVPVQEPRFGVTIGIKQALTKGSGLTEHVIYNIVGNDETESYDVMRRYSEFNFLRKKLNERWPGVFIPAIPTKQILGKNDAQVTQNRLRFLNQFLHKIANLPHIYKSEEVQVFLRGEGADITKQLDKFKQLPAKELLAKYEDAFSQYANREDSLKQRSQIDQFQKFIKSTQQLVENLKTRARELAESRDKYNSLAPKIFTSILSKYQANTLMEVSAGSESGSIFKSPQFPDLNIDQFSESTKNNPFWLIYDLLKFEQRQTKGMKQTINQLNQLSTRREQTIRKIQINKQEIKQLSSGKTTLRSLITPGSKQEIQVKLKKENEELEVLQEDLLKILNIATIQLNEQINQLKVNKFKFYYKVIKKVYSVEIHNIQGAIGYCKRLEDITDQFIH